jgi:hypothetical protein
MSQPTTEDFALIQTVASVHVGFANDKLAEIVKELREVGVRDQTIAACQMAMALRTFIEVFGRDQTLKMLEGVPETVRGGVFG